MSHAPTAKRIDVSVLAVLSAGRCEGPRFYLAPSALDRKLYEATNNVLTALGGKWNRSAKAHVFDEVCEPVIESAIESGLFVRPGDMGWFPTPAALAERVVDMAGVLPGMQVLEPSAGEGAIALAAKARGADVYAVEIEERRWAKLNTLGLWVSQLADFMAANIPTQFDRVVMNPPFAKRADIHHVLRARSLLKPGGRLVSIMSGGVEFRTDRLTNEFRDQCDTIERLPDGSFAECGTDVRTVIVTMGSQS